MSINQSIRENLMQAIDEVAVLEKTCRSLGDEIESLDNDVELMEKEIFSLKDEIKTLQKLKDATQDINADYYDKNESLMREAFALSQKMAIVEQHNAALLDENHKLTEQHPAASGHHRQAEELKVWQEWWSKVMRPCVAKLVDASSEANSCLREALTGFPKMNEFPVAIGHAGKQNDESTTRDLDH